MTISERDRAILWEIANLFRERGISGSDSTLHTLGLLALYCVDQYRRESGTNAALSLEGLPDWRDLIVNCANVGRQIDDCFRMIEQLNPWMGGWFSSLNYSRLQDAPESSYDRVLNRALKLIWELEESPNYRQTSVPFHELAMYLVEQLEVQGVKGGWFGTPEPVARLMMLLLQPKAGETLYSPFGFGGGGTILAEGARVMGETNHGETLYGNGISQSDLTVAALLLILQRCYHARLALADVIRSPYFATTGGRVSQFDRVAGTIPSGTRHWGDMDAMKDPYGRFIFGIPPPASGELAYLSHMIASTKPTGTLVAAVAPGVLYRGPPKGTASERSEGAIRRGLVEKDLIDAVIQLPARAYPGTAVPFVLLVLSPKKPAERSGKVLFIDARDEGQKGRARSALSDSSIKRIVTAYHDFVSSDGYSSVATREQIADKNWTLAVSDYVIQPTDLLPQYDLDKELAELTRLHQTKEELLRLLSDQVKRMENLS